MRMADKKCVEICGDRRKITTECDDGNTFNGDGCSAECSVEEGYNCEGGSPGNPDTCTKINYQMKITSSDVKPGTISIDFVVYPAPSTSYSQR